MAHLCRGVENEEATLPSAKIDGTGQGWRADQDAPPDLFDGTKEVRVWLDYSQCLLDFYQQSQDLKDKGAVGSQIFAAFANPAHANYLCAQDDPLRPDVDCDVIYAKQDWNTNRIAPRSRASSVTTASLLSLHP